MSKGGELDRRTLIRGGLAALAATLPFPAGAQDAGLFAFVVGNDRYTRMNPLSKAAADARMVARQLRKFRYRTFEAINQPQAGFTRIFDEFKAALASGGAAFIFYSGHGLQINGTNYLLPVDADCSNNRKFAEAAISLPDLLGELRELNPSQTVVLLDACRVAAGRIGVSGKGEGVASVNAPKGFFVAYSAGMGEFALDRLSADDPDPNGLFTRHFLPNMRPDRPIDSLVMSTSVEVSAAAEKAGYSQNCAIYNQSPRRLRLDGLQVDADDWVTPTPGRLVDTHVSLVGWGDYNQYTDLISRLPNVKHDIGRLAGLFQSLGATVGVYQEATRAELHDRLPRAIPASAKRHIIYYTGMGGLADGEMIALLGGTGDGGVDAISVRELLAVAAGISTEPFFAFAGRKPNADTRQPFKMDLAALGRDTILMLDTSLIELGIPPSGNAPRIALAAELGESELRSRNAPVAILSSCGILQNVLDGFEADVNAGAFVIALENAMKRPRLTLGQVAERVRSEVEMLTKHVQTPALFATGRLRDAVLVETAAS